MSRAELENLLSFEIFNAIEFEDLAATRSPPSVIARVKQSLPVEYDTVSHVTLDWAEIRRQHVDHLWIERMSCPRADGSIESFDLRYNKKCFLASSHRRVDMLAPITAPTSSFDKNPW
jgi:hypothetical protein